ncbi:MAG: hypothetical protein IPG34_16430 [Rhodocyclaceae bacterium]|nr:hypothetical protein [Rhodocyclaceae bacterium]
MKRAILLVLACLACQTLRAQEFIPLSSSLEGQVHLKGASKVKVEFPGSVRGERMVKERLEAIGISTVDYVKKATVVLKVSGNYHVAVDGEQRVADPLNKLLEFPRGGEGSALPASVNGAPAASVLSDTQIMVSLGGYLVQLTEQGLGSAVAQSCVPGNCPASLPMMQKLALVIEKIEKKGSQKQTLTAQTTSGRLLPHSLLDAALINTMSAWAQ